VVGSFSRLRLFMRFILNIMVRRSRHSVLV